MPTIGTRFGTRGLSIGPHRGRSTTTAEFPAPTPALPTAQLRSDAPTSGRERTQVLVRRERTVHAERLLQARAPQCSTAHPFSSPSQRVARMSRSCCCPLTFADLVDAGGH